MDHRSVLGQSDFGVGKTDRKSADLVSPKNGFNAGRVVDLSRVRPGAWIAWPPAAPALKKRGRKRRELVRKEETRPESRLGSAELYKKFSIGWSRWAEPLEITCPDQAEIMAMLEEIEAVNNSLKDYSWSPAAPALMEAEELIGADAAEYLWAEETEGNFFSEPENILDDLLKEPDASRLPAAILESAEAEETLAAPVLAEAAETAAEPDFLSRWRQARYQPETVSLVPASRKDFWRAKKNNWPKEKEFKKDAVAWPGSMRVLARQAAGFLSVGCLIYLTIFGMSLAGQGLLAKENILSSALQAYKSMLAAKGSVSELNFSAAGVDFSTAYQNFLNADQELNKMGRGIIYVLEKLPGGSVVGSGAALVDAGENFAKAGQSFSQIAGLFLVEDLGDYFSANGPSLTQKIAQAQAEIARAQEALASAAGSLQQVNAADLPADLAPQVAALKEKMAPVLEAASQLKNWSQVFLSALGHERAKKYLLVFQNNSEARATGGFIGTYGVADLDEGRLKNLFIDGIFDLDGQLYDKIAPPRPIQKISTAWSTHDANWFTDWPTSAKKIMSFYEKAGGQTADGVISLTPTVVERLLALTGPISLPQYGVTLDQNNFLDVTQYKVEVDYDKQLNEPKKILADFAPLFLDRLWQVWPEKGREIMAVLSGALAEKHILFYFSDPALEKAFAEQGWTGEILPTAKDYLSVINTNINGYKTDKVVEQAISHAASVQSDGSIIDTVRVTRTHRGGASQYDWYNKVNADYLRVYVPLGSKLLSAKGQTLEAYSAPIDYQAQGFKNDADVQAQEQGMRIDPNSGTQIFEESGKTVFGNWVFVSPGETVEVVYQYLLPFKIDLGRDSESYSLLAQKQAGSAASAFESALRLPASAKITWQYPADLRLGDGGIKFSGQLSTDKFYGAVFGL